MAENSITIQIEAGTSELVKGLQQADKAVVKFSGQVVSNLAPIQTAAAKTSQSISEGFTEAFSKVGKGVAIGNLVSSSILSIASGLKGLFVDSIDAAAEQEDAFNRLSQALRASGSYSREAVSDFAAFASELQKTSKFGDETVIAMVALAKNFGATNNQAKDLVLAAANLSATFGGSLEENVEKLGKTFTGSAGRLAQFIPELKNLTEAQLKSGAAFDIVNAKFAGAAGNELNTYSGSITAAKNAFSDMQEEIGAIITKNPLTVAAIELAKNTFNSLTGAIRAVNLELGFSDRTHTEAVEKATELSEEYAELETKLTKYRKAAEGDWSEVSWLERIGSSAKLAEVQVGLLEARQRSLKKEIDSLLPEDNTVNPDATNKVATGMSPEDKKMVDSRNEAYAQLQISRANYDAYIAEQNLASADLTNFNYETELAALQFAEEQKINAIYAAEEEKAKLIKDSQTRQYALDKIAVDKKAALDKSSTDSQKKVLNAQVAMEENRRAAMVGIMGSSFTLAAALAKDGSKEQFLIQKAAAIAEIAIARGKAIALIPAQTAHIPFPGNIPAAAQLTTYANIQAGLGLATVMASVIKGYENGGIVGGTSFHGDNKIVAVNSGEAILNRQQQGELMRVANGSGGLGGDALAQVLEAIRNMPIVVEANGREIARLVRDERANGFI